MTWHDRSRQLSIGEPLANLAVVEPVGYISIRFRGWCTRVSGGISLPTWMAWMRSDLWTAPYAPLRYYQAWQRRNIDSLRIYVHIKRSKIVPRGMGMGPMDTGPNMSKATIPKHRLSL